MAHALTTSDAWTASLTLATPYEAPPDAAGLYRLPSEWESIDELTFDGVHIDHAIVGPNGVFTVSVDPDPQPAALRDDGLYRAGRRVTTAVKHAVMAAHALRRRVGERLFAFPLLVTAVDGGPGHLDRLGIVPGGSIPEVVWSHPGMPLTRSQRMETIWSLRSLVG